MNKLGYRIIRQHGSHVRLEKNTPAGVHKITIPNHNPVAKGTLNDILSRVSIWNQISKEELIKKL
ncbi:MAG: type II toxin-antitoxin system HicA family toxin [Desulfobulbaceae bacterium]|nr:type II toxin-antitoxin system HicA family toxin [Desulfobulbaceae bacterium]